MPSKEHNELVNYGKRWLKQQGFPVIATEINAVGSRERPDLIAFRSTCSVIIEVKVSRADFFADQLKPERTMELNGLGLYRFYLCPAGLILPTDLPIKWGLLYQDGKTTIEVIRPVGNIWASRDCSLEGWREFQHKTDSEKEKSILFSIARRLSARPM